MCGWEIHNRDQSWVHTMGYCMEEACQFMANSNVLLIVIPMHIAFYNFSLLTFFMSYQGQKMISCHYAGICLRFVFTHHFSVSPFCYRNCIRSTELQTDLLDKCVFPLPLQIMFFLMSYIVKLICYYHFNFIARNFKLSISNLLMISLPE